MTFLAKSMVSLARLRKFMPSRPSTSRLGGRLWCGCFHAGDFCRVVAVDLGDCIVGLRLCGGEEVCIEWNVYARHFLSSDYGADLVVVVFRVVLG